MTLLGVFGTRTEEVSWEVDGRGGLCVWLGWWARRGDDRTMQVSWQGAI
jgi:hypothetical protein